MKSLNDGEILNILLVFGKQTSKLSMKWSGGIVVSTLVCRSLNQWFYCHSEY